MTMEELSFKLNTLLQANDYQVPYEYKTFLAAKAENFARIELERYRARIGAAGPSKAIAAPKARAKRASGHDA